MSTTCGLKVIKNNVNKKTGYESDFFSELLKTAMDALRSGVVRCVEYIIHYCSKAHNSS